MKTKLTLSVEKELIQFARRQARQDSQSVSSMFSEFLRARKERTEKYAAPRITAMVGTLKQYHIDDSKRAIAAAYAKKHTHRP